MSKITEAAEQLEEATKSFQGEGEPTEVEESVETVEQKASDSTLVDLDSLDKFMFQGKEYTPEDLNKERLMQSDYTKKTQALAKDRKFYDNLDIDLDRVRDNPSLADDFKAIYPEKFHRFLDYVLSTSEVEEDAPQEESDTIRTLQQTVQALQKKLETYDTKFHAEKIDAANAQIDAIVTEYGGKYDLADEDAVMNAAQRLIEENRENPDFKFTKGTWERLFKRDHERREKFYSDRQEKLLKLQEEKNKKGLDGGPGGLAPGRERKKFSFAEATEMAIQDLSR